ncbi:MAG: DUF5652 family protein [bacterium]|nr:DUF5652 family protein [bacterium]
MLEFLENNLLVTMVMLVWVLPWKGAALWIAAKKTDKWWFIALLIINTLAILDILYIYIFSKRTRSSQNFSK